MNEPTGRSDPAAGSAGGRWSLRLRGFGPVGLLAFVLIFFANSLFRPLGAMLVLLWAHLSHTPWREIGYVRPRSWVGGLALGVALGLVLKLLLKAVVLPLLGADPINHAYHYLAGNPGAALRAIPMMIFAAGFGEETYFRGYLFERLGKLIGQGPAAKVATVLATAMFFAALHYPDQGLAGAEQAVITGLVFGSIFARTGQLWLLMCAHAAYDLAALAIIYWDLETAVAQLVFIQAPP
jgi:membrane protease YdiL (CAAX protease family)